MIRNYKLSGLVALAGLMLLLAAVSPAAAGMQQIEVKNLVFAPAKIKAHVGDTLEWVNKDFVDHTATAKDGQWDVKLPANGTGKIILKKAGHIDYYCKYHPNMTGEIDVLP